ncbi:hypothetical protein psal_cds_180 [Pandoravirus salinus]|uniref:Uncharacterized protein n=1 Tax=Pandoravirus salinus TaxID=1349410 RepID=A0A291ATL0_9VIRU|nr:hypothetical protein psal_cds_180 [Pandoravirus salinus]ATE82129.1 hypothetical protein psal_cds_180 [Pandoravirus salinus]
MTTMATGTASQTRSADAESKRERRRNRHRSSSRHRDDRRSKAPSSSSAAVIDAAAAMTCARPLHVVLPACATDRIALPPAPVSSKYTAVFEVEFVNASPDTKIDLALAMRVDGHALLRNVQEVEANARRCVRLQVEVEVPKGHTASLSWRPFSRKPERLPAWLTIGRGEARMAVSAPPLQQQQPLAQPQPLGHPQQLPAIAASLPMPPPSHHTQGDDNDSATATHLVSDVEDADDRRRRRRRDRRRARETTPRSAKSPHRRRHCDTDAPDADDHARRVDNANGDMRIGGSRDKNNNNKRHGERGRSGGKRRDRHRHDNKERDQQSASRDPTTAAVATALAAVAAARNAHDDDDEDQDSVYYDESESVSVLPPSMGAVPHQARVLVPVTAVAHRFGGRRY